MTEVYTDSNNGPGTIQDRHILEGKGSRREGKTSPRLGQRRSSRIRKRDGTRAGFSDSSDSSSDDSDPNIHMGEDVLISEEEQMMMKDEAKMDMSQRAEKQILAVALMKSVLESNVTDMTSKPGKIKLENISDSSVGGQNINKCDSDNKNQSGETNGDDNNGTLTNVKMEVDESVPALTHSNGEIETNYVQLPLNNVGDGNSVEGVSTIKLEEGTKLQKATKTKPPSNTKATTYRSTRSRTKGAKVGRTMALKGAYASIREAPRVVRKPNVALPVPNPILPSSAPTEGQSNNITQQKEELVDKTMNVPVTCTDSNPQEIDSRKTRNNSVSFVVANHPGNPSANMPNNLPTRRRIFSIDLDRKYSHDTLSPTVSSGIF